jgi:hypothetical protein
VGGGKNILISTAGFSILSNGIFGRKAKTKRLFSQCTVPKKLFLFFALADTSLTSEGKK